MGQYSGGTIVEPPGNVGPTTTGPAVFPYVTDESLVTTDVTINNVSTGKHGFAPKLSGNATTFLDGLGNWTNPVAVDLGVTSISVATANGISGSSSGGATPILTLALGAITPSTVTIGAGAAITSSGAGGALGSNAFTSTAFVPTSTTVNGHALSANVTVAVGDITNAASTASSLAQFAATTSAQLAGVLSDETGTGVAVFDTSPHLTGPVTVALGSVTSPTNLTVGDTASTSPRGIMSWQSNTGTDGARLHLRKSRGTFASPTTIVTGDTIGRLIGSGYDGTGWLEMGSIDIMSTGTIGTNRIPTTMLFKTATDAATSVLTTALTLGADQSATFAGTVAGAFNGTIGATTPAAGTFTSSTFSTSLKSTTALATPSALSATQFTGFASTVSGASIMGYGTTNDVSLMNRAGTVVLGVGPNTTVVNIAGTQSNVAGTLPDGTSALKITATQPTTITGSRYAADLQITSAGSSSQINAGLNVDYLAGYTGSSGTRALRFVNAAAGTATAFANGNIGAVGGARATTTGNNIGVAGDAEGGNSNIGVFGQTDDTKNSATGIGVAGFAANSGTTPIVIGGYFGLQNTAPTYVSSALIADNGAIAAPIFIARDNGTAVFTIADGGMVTSTAGFIEGVQSLSGAGAVDVTHGATAYTSTGVGDALTLADGTNGQVKRIVHKVDGGSGVLTPTTKTGFSTVTFTNAGDAVTLQFYTTVGWIVTGSFGVTIA